MHLLQKIVSAEEALLLFNAFDADVNAQDYIRFSKKQNVDLKKINFSDLKVDGQKLFIPGIAEAFIFTKNKFVVQYKGADFKFNIYKSAEENFLEIKKSWGQFKELGLETKTSKLNIFLKWGLGESAHADKKSTELREINAIRSWSFFEAGLTYITLAFERTLKPMIIIIKKMEF